MKRNTTFIFAGIMSAIIGNAYATGENTVTSKSYVDAEVATKQDKITAGTTGSVVTYNGTQNGQAQFSEREIFDTDTGWDSDELVVIEGHEGDLLTAGSIDTFLADLQDTVDYIGSFQANMEGLANTVVVRDNSGMPHSYRDIYDGSTTYTSNDADSLATASFVESKANHMTCAGWPDSVAVADRTDENCWLWNKN